MNYGDKLHRVGFNSVSVTPQKVTFGQFSKDVVPNRVYPNRFRDGTAGVPPKNLETETDTPEANYHLVSTPSARFSPYAFLSFIAGIMIVIVVAGTLTYRILGGKPLWPWW